MVLEARKCNFTKYPVLKQRACISASVSHVLDKSCQILRKSRFIHLPGALRFAVMCH